MIVLCHSQCIDPLDPLSIIDHPVNYVTGSHVMSSKKQSSANELCVIRFIELFRTNI